MSYTYFYGNIMNVMFALSDFGYFQMEGFSLTSLSNRSGSFSPRLFYLPDDVMLI